MPDLHAPSPRHVPPQPREATDTGPSSSPWAGWILFGAVMMIVVGLSHAFQGLLALVDDDYYLVGRSGLAISVDYSVWGWAHLSASAFVIATGIALLNGRAWARTVGVVLAVLSVLVNFAFLAAYPVWSAIMIGIDVVVIWALTVHFDEVRA